MPWPGGMPGGKSNISSREFDSHLQQIMDKLSEKNLLTIYRDLLRRVPALSLSAEPTQDGSRRIEIADPRPQSRPDKALELAEDRSVARRLTKLLEEAIQTLPSSTRNILMLHSIQGFSGEEIRRIMRFRKRQRVYDELSKARRKIGIFLKKAGVNREQIKRAEGFLDGSDLSPDKKS